MAVSLRNHLLAAIILSAFFFCAPSHCQYIATNQKSSEGAGNSQSNQPSVAKAIPQTSTKISSQTTANQSNTKQAVGTDQGSDSTVIAGVNTAGTVRVNNLAMLEALFNIGANGAEILCITAGISLLLVALFRKTNKLSTAVLGLIPIAIGLATPSAVNRAIEFLRDANMFS